MAITGFILGFGALVFDFKALKEMRSQTTTDIYEKIDLPYVGRSLYFMLWLVGIFLVTYGIGQFPALILFVCLYLKYWGNYSWKIIGLYFVGSVVFLLVMFNEIVPVMWYEPAFLPPLLT